MYPPRRELTLDDSVMLFLSTGGGRRVDLGELSTEDKVREHTASRSIIITKGHNPKTRFHPYCQA